MKNLEKYHITHDKAIPIKTSYHFLPIVYIEGPSLLIYHAGIDLIKAAFSYIIIEN